MAGHPTAAPANELATYDTDRLPSVAMLTDQTVSHLLIIRGPTAWGIKSNRHRPLDHHLHGSEPAPGGTACVAPTLPTRVM